MASDALLAECLAAPRDDAPRLVWADADGGARGELVVVQRELARGGLGAAASGARRRRQRDLLAAHGRAWSGLDGLATFCRFRRGFVEHARFASWSIADRLDDILLAAPLLDSIAFDGGTTPAQVERLLGHPRYARIRGLGVPPLDAEVIARVVAANAFARLVALDLSIDARVHGAQFKPLLRGDHFANVERLALRANTDDDATALVERMPRLRAVDLVFARDPAGVLPALAPGVVELTIAADALDALATGPLAAGIERLSLRSIPATSALRVLARFPALRSLDLDMYTRDHPQLEPSFAALALPALRELRCNAVPPETLHAIADAFGEQLELCEPGARDVDADLRARFAGDLHVSPLVGARPPLFAGELPHAPMWDYPRVWFGASPRADL